MLPFLHPVCDTACGAARDTACDAAVVFRQVPAVRGHPYGGSEAVQRRAGQAYPAAEAIVRGHAHTGAGSAHGTRGGKTAENGTSGTPERGAAAPCSGSFRVLAAADVVCMVRWKGSEASN